MGETESSGGLLDVLRDFLGPPARELGSLSADHIRLYRWRSALWIVRRAKAIAEEKHIRPSEVPIKFLVPFLERSSLEDEASDMAERWSQLLATAVNGYQPVHSIYSNILAQITSEQARVLKEMWCSARAMDVFHFDNYSSMFNHLPGEYDLAFRRNADLPEDLVGTPEPGKIKLVFRGDNIPNTNEFILDGFSDGHLLMHLESLRLVRNASDSVTVNKERFFVFQSQLTPFGYDFVTACEDGSDHN